ncbi:hypothetical protein QLQ86_08655 [Halomonas sp. LR5S13]|uniref:hypothetical protein n=1 Tax=Halomonas rhizosphaerae TaxID=3043296 RepID=UPI0024A9C9B5|nr:hypothetical protein [Halomonas rhizosphaerae]MDI5920852.1 hypothetical protein [Halomonas rhizosphaerae]
MAGIFGVVTAERSKKLLPQWIHVAPGGSARYQRLYWRHTRRMLLGALHGAIPPDDCFDPDHGIGVLVHGVSIDPETGNSLTAPTLLSRYRQEGCSLLKRLDGDYLIVILDLHHDILLVANDRMGTCPLHYHAGDEAVAFATEPWLVCALSGLRPELDEIGALEFMSMGHAVDARTLFKDVHLLEPAQVITISLIRADVQCSTYWQLNFQPCVRIRERQAASDLRDAMCSAVRAVKPSLSDNAQLLLTGGYDSRTLLALLCQEDAMPGRALCWGVSDSVPCSDVDIASRVAAGFGMNFRFLHYDQESFTSSAERWVRAAGLCSDNLGNFVAGPDFLGSREWNSSRFLVGDQLLGVGGMPVSRRHAFEVSSGLPFSGPVAGLSPFLRGHSQMLAAELASAGVHRLVNPFWDEPSKDVQDHLSYRLHMARWLNAPTFFREPLVPSVRPMLHQPVMALFQMLPAWLRVDKRLLLSMLKHHFPDLLQWPRASADSLVDWKLAMTRGGATAAMFQGLVCDDRLADSSLSRFLDSHVIRSRLQDYADHPVGPMSRRPASASMITSIRRRGSRYRIGGLAISIAQRGINRARRQSVGADAWRVLQRIALISLLLRVMESPAGKSSDSRPYIDLKQLHCRWHHNEIR